MNIYENYLEFLDDLIKWGDDSRAQHSRISPLENLRSLLLKSSKSAEQDVFSPFLYVCRLKTGRPADAGGGIIYGAFG